MWHNVIMLNLFLSVNYGSYCYIQGIDKYQITFEFEYLYCHCILVYSKIELCYSTVALPNKCKTQQWI